MNRKTITLAAALVCLIAILAVGTLAYFTDGENAKNTFTVGNVDIELTEPNWEKQGSVDAPDVYPGEPLAKDPTVENIGINPCFVRIRVHGLDMFGDKGMITYRTNYVTDALGEGWELHGNYFYYTKVLQPGDKTTAVFDQIVIPTGIENLDGLEQDGSQAQFEINVDAEAVQAQGARPSFSAVQNMTVSEIADWFVTCGLEG